MERAFRAGTGPRNWLDSRFRSVRLVRALRSVSGPLKPILGRRSSVTRPFASVATPYQAASGSALSQLSFRVQLGPFVTL